MSDKTDTSLFDGKNPIDEIAKDDIINTYRTHCSTCKIGGAFMAGIRKKSPERKTAIREFAERFYLYRYADGKNIFFMTGPAGMS